jgi:hypothetical protein
MDRANKEDEREGNVATEGGGLGVDGEALAEDGDDYEEEWEEEDEELVGLVQGPEPPEEIAGDAEHWLYDEFGDRLGEA